MAKRSKGSGGSGLGFVFVFVLGKGVSLMTTAIHIDKFNHHCRCCFVTPRTYLMNLHTVYGLRSKTRTQDLRPESRDPRPSPDLKTPPVFRYSIQLSQTLGATPRPSLNGFSNSFMLIFDRQTDSH